MVPGGSTFFYDGFASCVFFCFGTGNRDDCPQAAAADDLEVRRQRGEWEGEPAASAETKLRGVLR